MITDYEVRTVRIVKALPGHPVGAIRKPHPDQVIAWLRQGVAVPADPVPIVRKKRGHRNRRG